MISKRRNLLIGAVIVILLVGYLIYGGIKDTMVYYVTVSELKAKSDALPRGFRLAGNVKEESTSWDSETLTLKFQVVDENAEAINVIYQGAVPDMFNEGADVIVEGSFNRENSTFHAEILLAKCPSKYESEKEESDQYNTTKEKS